ncbi:MAG: hypothetical protein WC100_07420 [Sterolibacterium sp.]
MKNFLIAAMVATTAGLAVPALAGDLGVSLSYGEPGFYGRLDIGDYPQPQVIYRRPVTIERVSIDRPPVYLHVPPGHAKNWRRHCGKYGACGERVYFVQDNWYNREYVPRYRERHQDRRDDRHEERRDNNRGDQRNDHRGDSQGHGRNR